ncbi:hypothetical protein B7463_g5943, partial [Scytalidium lignicola]
MYKSVIYIGNHLATKTLGNLRSEELVVKAQDAKAVAEASSSCSLLSLPSTLQDATLPSQLNSMFEEVVQSTEEEEEEVFEDKLPQVVIPIKRGHNRLKGLKNKKPEQGYTNSDIIHVDLTENCITHLQAAKSSTQAPSPVVSPPPVVSRAFPDEGEILGQLPAVVIAYGYCLTACSALNLRYALTVTDDPTEPKSYKEALDTPYSQEWQDAMVTELKSLVKCKTFKLTWLPPGKHALKGRWVYRIKRNVDCQIEHFKARFVVKGYEQRYGVDYDQTWASVVKSTT